MDSESGFTSRWDSYVSLPSRSAHVPKLCAAGLQDVRIGNREREREGGREGKIEGGREGVREALREEGVHDADRREIWDGSSSHPLFG